MSTWLRRPHRLAASIGVCIVVCGCAALLFLTLFASDAVPREVSPHPAAEDAGAMESATVATGAKAVELATVTTWAEAVEPATATTGAQAAMARPAAPLAGTELEAAQPEAEATPVAQAPAQLSSPPPFISVPTPVKPVVSAAPARDCSPRVADDFRITNTSPASASLEVSKAAFDCAHEVGLAFADNPAAISTLSSQDIEGPLLLADSDLSVPLIEELTRLAPQRVVAVGIDEQLWRPALSDFVVEAVEAKNVEVGDRPPHDRVWIVDDAENAAPLAAIAHRVGVGVVAAAGDLRALPRSAREAISAASEVELLSDLGDDAAWQLEVIRRGEELPGGGLLMFEAGDESPARRLVAVYGHPSTGALGVLGEQGPEDAVKRLRSIAEGYGADGSAVLPTFEIIATVASASPSADGDYSSVTDHEAIRPWIETAAANGVYVVLDLQPGRSDFLSQAKLYEEFLRMPHVGLALDPEWRLEPHQVHLVQVGTVDAAEVNRVVDWLAGIVREEALPQKLLIVHQFRFSMITNRELIETPPELAVLIHMDGQGSLGAKFNTWSTLTGEPDADRFYWGWKNFYDEDSPMATPEQVLDLSPEIVFVSFQ